MLHPKLSPQKTSGERLLLQRAKELDMQAMADIYDRYSPSLFRYAFRLLGENQAAEDCVAETFSRFLSAIQNGSGPDEHLQAYLYRIAQNWVTDQYRKNFRREAELPANLHDNGEDMLDMTAQVIETQQVRTALSQLTQEQRQVVMLKYVEGWENAEIAVAMDKPIGSVKALQHRAIGALRKLINKE